MSKLGGTACSSIAFYLLSSRQNALLNFCFVAVFAWDALYVALLVYHWLQQKGGEEETQRQQQVEPWLRGDAAMIVSHAVLAEPSASVWRQQNYRALRHPS